MAKATQTRGRGRPSKTETGKQRAALLKTIGTENAPSRFILMQLAEAGLVQFEAEKTGTRGRPRHVATLTGKGRNLVALSARWG